MVRGPDFVSDPRWRPDGAAFCWLEWDHPDMPWDATRLVVDEGGRRTMVAGGGERESVGQPTWAPDGSLWFFGDRSGVWSLYRWTPELGREPMVELGLDIGFAQWVFGQSCFAFLEDGRLVFSYSDGGLEHLAIRDDDTRQVTPLELPHTLIEQLHACGNDAVYLAASPTAEVHVASVSIDSGTVEMIVPPRDLGLAATWFARPEPIEFPTAGGAPPTPCCTDRPTLRWAAPRVSIRRSS